MTTARGVLGTSTIVALAMVCSFSPAPAADTQPELLRQTLRQQDTGDTAACAGVRRALTAGGDPALVVRTAVELGYNACQVMRCALDGNAGGERELRCGQVIRGAASAGVPADVISRCSEDVCDPTAVAALLADPMFDFNYCYIGYRPQGAPDPPAQPPVIYRAYPQQEISPFTFPASP